MWSVTDLGSKAGGCQYRGLVSTAEPPRSDTRDYFSSLEEAMREYKIPVENHPLVRETAARLEYADVYIPRKSRPYIALAKNGAVVAYVNSGRIDIPRGDGTYENIELPTHGSQGLRSGGRHSRVVETEPAVCPVCCTALPATGVCDECY